MDSDKALREHVINLLNGAQAYAPFDEIVKDFPEKYMNTVFPNGTYSAWQLLEHLRLTQFSTLDFMTSKKYVEMKWPDEYWPEPNRKATKKDWDKTIAQFKKDLELVKKVVKDPKIDPYAKVPNGTGQTFLREYLLIADHNAYHLGEFAIMRQVMGTWGKTHDK